MLIWNNERTSLAITVEGDDPSKMSYAIINGVKIKPDRTGAIWVPKDFKSGNIQVINEIRGKINCSRLFATTVMANFLTIG